YIPEGVGGEPAPRDTGWALPIPMPQRALEREVLDGAGDGPLGFEGAQQRRRHEVAHRPEVERGRLDGEGQERNSGRSVEIDASLPLQMRDRLSRGEGIAERPVRPQHQLFRRSLGGRMPAQMAVKRQRIYESVEQ